MTITSSYPDITKQSVALAKYLKLDVSTEIKEILDKNYTQWEPFTSYQELMALIAFGFIYINGLPIAVNLDIKGKVDKINSFLSITESTLNDKSKLLHLNQLGLAGICDFYKVNTQIKIGIVVDILGSREVFDFLQVLAVDQENENSSQFLNALKFVGSLPVD